MDLKKATPSRLAALKSAMASGAGQAPQSDDDVMQSPQNAPSGEQDPAAQEGEGAPPTAEEPGAGDSGMDPVGSIAEAQDAIQQALGQSDDPEDHQSLSKANDLLQQAAAILQKHYDQEGQEPADGGPDDDEETGPGGQSEGTDYQGDGT